MENTDGDNNPATDPPIDEINEASNQRGVEQIAVIGFSHGGGTAHDMAPHIPDVDFMTYLDAVQQEEMLPTDPEVRRPNDVDYLLNIYQPNGPMPWDLGGADMGNDANENINTDTNSMFRPKLHRGINPKI